MGIPTYFRKIIEENPDANFWNPDMHVDHLLIDFNAMIYTVLNDQSSEAKLIDDVINQLNKVITIVRPSVSVHIAMDGPPPFAKMVQQRARRYKSLKEQQFIKELEVKYGTVIKRSKFDKSAISPGTIFMSKLSTRIRKYIKELKIDVSFSDDRQVGEGEHKLLPILKSIKGTIVVYSPDADLIVLSVMSGNDNIFILRDDSLGLFTYLSIDLCRSEFIRKMAKDRDYKKTLLDYSFLTFLCGNDFVTAAPFLKVKEGGIDLLINVYNEVRDTDQYITTGLKINNIFLLKILKSLSLIETARLQKWQKKRDRIRKNPVTYENTWEQDLLRFNHEEYYSPVHPHFAYLNKVFDNIDYFNKNWNTQYNLHFFGTYEVNEINDVCFEYYKSLDFCLRYYEGVPSWNWAYLYHAAPSITQFSNYLEHRINLKITWEPSNPCSPFEQLAYILPKQSFKLLPCGINTELMKLKEYYPDNFILNIVQGTKFIYSDPILPNIPMHLINEIVKNAELNKAEKLRNLCAAHHRTAGPEA